MLWKSTVATLSILVAVATALPYNEWNNARYQYNWKDFFAARDQEIGARVRSQAAVDKSSCAAVTETKDEKSYKVRLCEADPEDDPNNVCLATRVNPCCSGEFSQGNKVSSTDVDVGGETVTLTYYLTQDPTAKICFRLDDTHLSSKTCSQSRLEGVSCLPPCLTISTACFNNTLTGDSSSCDNNVCQCKTGYLPPDCCQCDTNNFYLPECNRFCRDNCRLFRPLTVGGCLTCREGYIGAPECCECDTVGNATHAFYRTPFGECIPFCKSNCAVIGSSGCNTCKTGYVSEPECCECDTAGNATHAFYRTPSGECKPFCKSNCAVIGSSGCDTCKTGYVSEPECCECDTAGNATHAFYRTPSGECKPFCKSNCAVIGSSGCDSCKSGFIAIPECCQCEPGRREVNGICKCISNLNPDGSCIPEARPDDCCECKTGNQKNPTTERCEPERCDKQQNLFFYIDATRSNEYNNFCGLIVVMQMLVAAFNPSPMSGTQIFSVLFPGQNKPPSTVIDMGTSCLTAVEGSDKSLKTLMIDFGLCQDSDEDKPYDSSLFPSSCGEGTSAVEGLQDILSIASRSRSSTEGAIVMLTDGVIEDKDSERTKVLSDLERAEVRTLIAAGIGRADVENLKLYTSESNILVGSDPVELGIDIVNKMEERGIVCKDHADNITRSLREVQGTTNLLKTFCECHRKPHVDENYCQRKYPTCGGSLKISFGPQGTGRTKIQEDEDLENVYVDQQLLEEEILAAVEKVLDQRYHG